MNLNFHPLNFNPQKLFYDRNSGNLTLSHGFLNKAKYLSKLDMLDGNYYKTKESEDLYLFTLFWLPILLNIPPEDFKFY
jgi:hypothetical protein